MNVMSLVCLLRVHFGIVYILSVLKLTSSTPSRNTIQQSDDIGHVYAGHGLRTKDMSSTSNDTFHNTGADDDITMILIDGTDANSATTMITKPQSMSFQPRITKIGPATPVLNSISSTNTRWCGGNATYW